MNEPGTYRSQLFTLRLWLEPGARHPDEIRCKVQDLQSGEVRYFSSWPALIAYLDAVFKDGGFKESGDDALHRHSPDASL